MISCKPVSILGYKLIDGVTAIWMFLKNSYTSTTLPIQESRSLVNTISKLSFPPWIRPSPVLNLSAIYFHCKWRECIMWAQQYGDNVCGVQIMKDWVDDSCVKSWSHCLLIIDIDKVSVLFLGFCLYAKCQQVVLWIYNLFDDRHLKGPFVRIDGPTDG